MRYMPLSEVDDPLTRSLACHASISSSSLGLYITHLVPLVEKISSKSLPDLFGIMMDGCTDGSTHYICVIATYMEDKVYREVLLGCSPPLNEKKYTAEEHYELLRYVLAIYGKSITSPAVLIGDNCSTNMSLADLIEVPLIGCGFHKLNLAVKSFLSQRPVVKKTISEVDKVVSQLRNLKAAGALRELTPLCAVKRTVTSWSSTHKMLERFLKIESAAKQLDDVDTIRRADSERIKTILPTLENFKSVMTALQKKGQYIGAVHETFQLMVEDYPELGDYLAADASISDSPVFESACAKTINGQQELLTNEEKAQVHHFLVRPMPQEPVEGSNAGKRHSHVSRLRDRKRQRRTVCEEYPDLRFIAGTSAPAERLFSSAKHVLRSTRKRLTPVNFEKLLFLKHNRHLWNADMVAQAMKTRDTTEN
ncbi:hypothetical protein PC129_g5623 [Phytophthora cactorum]|uniref:HAT C-terminal dimerisation domain-containing protein n=1 Tax=Phytophthora cactorum TaxID=29920 RepID=A0A8T1LLB4_9STRA|nr:hypothetical protein PC111_g7523 [Phytophthora cactorum]KAG2832674.1 hypothetical protein PC112_g6804 [Phytophthora cactorum]KAG2864855.1 hypothetical protein PC113_g4194 [Phytophthora cactorum]KAG2911491.1 hypothetical protein PC114_g9339 [Phytophthora cactorum]KAG2926506.1 hypothetical protein PC115_g7879 [Phytophthora cactorum]